MEIDVKYTASDSFQTCDRLDVSIEVISSVPIIFIKIGDTGNDIFFPLNRYSLLEDNAIRFSSSNVCLKLISENGEPERLIILSQERSNVIRKALVEQITLPRETLSTTIDLIYSDLQHIVEQIESVNKRPGSETSY